MAAKKQRKIRVDLRKNRAPTARRNDLTRAHQDDQLEGAPHADDARMSGKGGRTRRRTIIGEVTDGDQVVRAVDASLCQPGRVLKAIGATQCTVQDEATGALYECSVRRMLRTMASDERTAVVAGDRVLFQPLDAKRGVIERVEPRQGVLSRGHQYREHILVANVTQVMIVASLAEPHLKPALIDRFLISAAKGGVSAAICFNKADLVDLTELQAVIGLYNRLGYPTVVTSIATGFGVERLRQQLRSQQTVFAGQSGVGKSSLLNAIQPGLALRTGPISETSQKGKHTTRSAELRQLDFGGWVVDTPGIRQMALWDVPAGEIEAHFREFRPFVPQCKYPNCLHMEETGCAIRQAVRDHFITHLRYESYLRLVMGDE
ncbi:MAG TPA: ribosome small subunit-dependent GTPase A [Planctomycetaceae bacterium]|nr:ribosome small subunit-dependent GTPase A [Planctomycetaceae bacterium]